MGETIDDSNAASTPDVGSSGRIDPAAGARTAREDAQRRDMMSTLERGGFLRDWATTWQHEGERVLLERLRDGLRGDVLELASGGGRLTRRLIEIAGSLHGFDIAPDMVAYCQETFPSATFSQLEYSGLSRWDGERWDAVCSGCNSFDVLTDEERNALFGNVARLLRPGGIFIFSTHNLGSPLSTRKPWHLAEARHPVRLREYAPWTDVRAKIHWCRLSLELLARWLVTRPRALSNHRRLAPFERVEDGYAIVNDGTMLCSLLQVYISRDHQETQLARHGLELLECVDEDGATVGPGEARRGSQTLYYAARRPA
jgi:SAM-dependent methyltransferase